MFNFLEVFKLYLPPNQEPATKDTSPSLHWKSTLVTMASTNDESRAQSPLTPTTSESNGTNTPAQPQKAISSIQSTITATNSLKNLQAEEQRTVLETVARVRKCGLDGQLSLPQLVVCGDQSAGKSSVLEALTEIPFPRNDNLCTRFATEIILRQATRSSITVKVIPDSERPSHEQHSIKAFQKSIIDFSELPDVMRLAMNVMGITEDLSVLATSQAFAKDVLSIEIEGPTQPHLTLVDIPGLIATETRGVTAEDVDLVAEITAKYISNQRTICLAVVSAANDYANQKILKKVREVDPAGHRTLGIITKPDRIDGEGSLRAFVELAQNEDIHFSLGWHVLKNRSAAEKDITLEQRKKSEAKWFRESGFKDLPSHAVGIDSLRKRLSLLLFEHVKRELPGLRQELDDTLEDAQTELEMLGRARSSTKECNEYLNRLAFDYQQLCKAGVDGHYEHNYFSLHTKWNEQALSKSASSVPDQTRARASIQDLNDKWSESFRKNGHTYYLKLDDEQDEEIGSNEKAVEKKKKDVPLVLNKSKAISWASDRMTSSRGKELIGNFNPLLVAELFWVQSSKWHDLAARHVEKVDEYCGDFLRNMLTNQCPKDVRDRIWSIIKEELQKRKHAADEELDKIMLDVRSYPINYNHYYTDNIFKCRRGREERYLADLIEKNTTRTEIQGYPYTSKGQSYGILGVDAKIDTGKVVAGFYQHRPVDMQSSACLDALDCLIAIYKVSNSFTGFTKSLSPHFFSH